ncbi:alpha/beta-hydrolase [Peniophora sp. CONT]|nr:alpha/beta-hydrolase [Peniophora sp. CONT]
MTVHDLRTQPVRSLYLLYQAFSTIFVRLPWWVVISIRRKDRPRTSWTLRKAVFLRLVRHLQGVSARTGPVKFIADHLKPSVGPDIKVAWCDPAPEALLNEKIRGWMKAANVDTTRIPGYWMDKKGLESTPIGAPVAQSERVLYSLHGGAYISLSASPKDILANIGRGILKHTPSITRCFALEYRLSRAEPNPPANAFPAALLDALAGYLYLINDVGCSPSQIVLVGDSAGANLAHALTRYLVENAGTPGLPPPPENLLLLSPWADLTGSHMQAAYKAGLCDSDYLGVPGAPLSSYAVRAFLGPHGLSGAGLAYISPGSIEPSAEIPVFENFPRTMIVAGGAEALLFSIRELSKRMKEALGEKCEYYEAEDAVHDFLVFPKWEPERTQTLREIAKWVAAA